MKLAMIFAVFLSVLPGYAYGLQRESVHFVFYYEPQDSSAIDTLIDRLEKCYPRITADLQAQPAGKTGVHIYPSLDTFHQAIGWPDASDYIVGVAWTSISIVSPLNSGPYHPYREMVDEVIVHEFTHVVLAIVNGRLPYWTAEGFPVFEGGPYPHSNYVLRMYQKLNRLPTMDELNPPDYDTFVSFAGYNMGYNLVKYLIDNYGMSSMHSFILRPSDFSVFGGLTKESLQANWHAYLMKSYIATDIDARSSAKNKLSLESYPNPISAGAGDAMIRYAVSEECRVSLTIVDIAGRTVARLVDTRQNPGSYSVLLETDTMSSGIYFSRLTAGRNTLTQKILLVR